MSKLTVAELKNFGTNYVAASEQAGTWEKRSDNMYDLLDKVGKQITISNNYSDKLPELDGEELSYGKSVEQFFVDLPVIVDGPKNKGLTPEDEEAYATGALKPYLPEVEDVCYSYTLGRKVIPTTIPANNIERAAINAEAAGTMIADITSKLAAAESLYKYAAKKQLLGNVAKAAIEKGEDLVVSVGDTTTVDGGENFIKEVKQAIEDASFAHEGGLNGALIGATDTSNLMLVVSKNVMSSLETKVWAGAFNLDKVSFPNITIKVVEDFGDQTGIKAMLIDKRGVRLHPTYRAIKTMENAYFDAVNVFSHMEYTAFYSKYTFVRVFQG